MGLAYDQAENLSANAATNLVKVALTVGKKYTVGDSIKLENNLGSFETVAVTAVTYDSNEVLLTVGSIGSISQFTTAKYATAQIQSYFTALSNPSYASVLEWIGEAEDEIENNTRTAWSSQGTFEGYIRWEPRRVYLIGEPFEWYKIRLPYPDPVLPPGSAAGDSLKVWDGGSETEWVGVKTEGRTGDFWCDGKSYLYINTLRPWPGHNTIYIKYRHGATTAPGDVKKACIYLACEMFLASNLYNNQALNIAKEGEAWPYMNAQSWYHKRAYEILQRHRRLIY
jgi:hypothetical protein